MRVIPACWLCASAVDTLEGRHDNIVIRSYAVTRRREVERALQHAIETGTSYADNPMEEARVDDDGRVEGRCDMPSEAAAARNLGGTGRRSARSESSSDQGTPSMFKSRAAEVMEPFVAAVTEYEAAFNTSVSG